MINASFMSPPMSKANLRPRPAHSLFVLLSSGRRYRALSTRTTSTEQFLPSGNPSHEHLTITVEHTLFIHIYPTHILSLHLKFAHNIPVHTTVSLYIVIPYLLVLFLILLFIICVYCSFILLHCGASVTKTCSSFV